MGRLLIAAAGVLVAAGSTLVYRLRQSSVEDEVPTPRFQRRPRPKVVRELPPLTINGDSESSADGW